MATSVPMAPMAIPRVAVAMAGASFTPSPTMATPRELASARTASTFSCGRSPAFTSSAPSSAAMARTASGWSPERTVIQRIPSYLRCRMVAAALGLSASPNDIAPEDLGPLPT
jgi:hypothetical protein